ncbi:MAG: D-2-hydroxyacid dehydrogenase [Bacteroidales bacterium]|nr:D-2-hydroxyacid dehydrogenase [Bacteroidales bacterium]
MINIVFLDAKTVGEVSNFRVLEKQGTLKIYETTSPADIIERCKDQDVVITSKVKITEEIMSQLPDLKLICVAATGMNNIDLEAAGKLRIKVMNVASYSTESVAQLTFSMLLYLVNHLNYYDSYVKSGAYSGSDIFTHFGPAFWELNGKRLGIIGLGNIGRRVAQIAQSFGMEVVFYSTTARNNNINYKRFDLDTLLSTSDVVSIHAPLTDQTRALINYEKIHMMRPCAILLNTGRGGIIVEEDLARALNDNLIAAAGIDVLEHEPPSALNPLLQIKNKEKILITPHIAWTSIEARQRLIDKLAKNIEEFRKQL